MIIRKARYHRDEVDLRVLVDRDRRRSGVAWGEDARADLVPPQLASQQWCWHVFGNCGEPTEGSW
jgi:hypothetical protein